MNIKRIHIENMIWVIYLFIIIFNLYSNYLEEKYINTNNKILKNKYHKINETILFIIIFIYLYFFYITYQDSKDTNNIYNKILLIGSLLFLIAGILTFYAVKNLDILDEEIAI